MEYVIGFLSLLVLASIILVGFINWAVGIGTLIAFAVAVWVYRDAQKREMKNAFGWAAGVFLVLIIFFPAYMIFRKEKPGGEATMEQCEKCGVTFMGGPKFCPNCGTPLQKKEETTPSQNGKKEPVEDAKIVIEDKKENISVNDNETTSSEAGKEKEDTENK